MASGRTTIDASRERSREASRETSRVGSRSGESGAESAPALALVRREPSPAAALSGPEEDGSPAGGGMGGGATQSAEFAEGTRRGGVWRPAYVVTIRPKQRFTSRLH